MSLPPPLLPLIFSLLLILVILQAGHFLATKSCVWLHTQSAGIVSSKRTGLLLIVGLLVLLCADIKWETKRDDFGVPWVLCSFTIFNSRLGSLNRRNTWPCLPNLKKLQYCVQKSCFVWLFFSLVFRLLFPFFFPSMFFRFLLLPSFF